MTPLEKSIEACNLAEADKRLFRNLAQLAVNADWVTRERFEYYGLCDCIDNAGTPYPSQWSADLIKQLKSRGVAVEKSGPHRVPSPLTPQSSASTPDGAKEEGR